MKTLLLVTLIIMLPHYGHALNAVIGAGIGRTSNTRDMPGSFAGTGQIGIETSHMAIMGGFFHIQNLNYYEEGAFNEGELELIPLVINLYARMPVGKSRRVKLHLGGGLNYLRGDHTRNKLMAKLEDMRQERIRDEIKSQIGFNLMAGFEYRLNKTMTLDIDVYQFFFDAWTVRSSFNLRRPLKWDTHYIITRLDIDFMVGIASIKYHF